MMYYYGPMGGNGWGIFAGFLWLIAFLFIMYVALRAFKTLQSGRISYENPESIIKKRYAKGEITQDQYEQLKKDIL